MSKSKFSLDDYVDVAERIAEFRAKYPEGGLQAELLELPEAFAANFIAVKGYAFRSADDPNPGVGLAWEPVPGRTPYTQDSELQNAETSAWGRAIVAVGAADTKRGIASRQEVQNRSSESSSPPSGTLQNRAEGIRLRKKIREEQPDYAEMDQLPDMTIEQLREVAGE